MDARRVFPGAGLVDQLDAVLIVAVRTDRPLLAVHRPNALVEDLDRPIPEVVGRNLALEGVGDGIAPRLHRAPLALILRVHLEGEFRVDLRGDAVDAALTAGLDAGLERRLEPGLDLFLEGLRLRKRGLHLPVVNDRLVEEDIRPGTLADIGLEDHGIAPLDLSEPRHRRASEDENRHRLARPVEHEQIDEAEFSRQPLLGAVAGPQAGVGETFGQ